MTSTCPVCGKHFVVLYPHLWAYKRADDYYCSWKCLRTLDKEEEEKPIVSKSRLTKEQREEAVRIALDGGDPFRYLEECGSNNAPVSWYAIKQKLLENDPETYEKLPKRVQRKAEQPTESLADAMAGMKDAADEFFSKCADAGLNLDIPEKPKCTDPLTYDGYTVRCIEGKYGRFYFDAAYDRLDWTTPDGEEVSFSPDGWKAFCTEVIPQVCAILGVEL